MGFRVEGVGLGRKGIPSFVYTLPPTRCFSRSTVA